MTPRKLLLILGLIVLFILLLVWLKTSKAQTVQPFRSVVWMEVWTYDQFPPFKLPFNAITDLVFFGGATAGATPSATLPYFPYSNFSGSAYNRMFHGVGWTTAQKYYPGSTKTWVQILRDSCAAHGITMYVDLGGEYGSPSSSFRDLVLHPERWNEYWNEVDAVGQSNPDGVMFGGVSIDWEYVGTGGGDVTARTNFKSFLDTGKVHLARWNGGKGAKLGMAAPMWYLWNNNPSTPWLEASVINSHFDWVFLMNYNTWQGNPNVLCAEAQVYQNPAIPNIEVWNDRSVKQYRDNGVNVKLLIPGTSGEVLSQTATGAIQPGGPATGTTTGGGVTGRTVTSIFANALYDAIGQFAYGVNGAQWLSFETERSVTDKVNFSIQNGTGGTGWYSVWASSNYAGAAAVNLPLAAYGKVVSSFINTGVITPPPPDTTHNPPPPPPVVLIWTKAQGDSLYRAGQLSVVCAPIGYSQAQMDSAVRVNWNAVLDAIPNSVSATVPKPARKP